MKTRNFLAVGLAFLVISSANAYTLSSDDQARVDGAVSKIETTISKKGESYRSRIIIQLQGYLPGVKNNEQITAMLQNLIQRVQKTDSSVTQIQTGSVVPTASNAVNAPKGYITPSTTEIDPIKKPMLFALIYGHKVILAYLKETNQNDEYVKTLNRLVVSYKENSETETWPLEKKVFTEFHTQLQEMLDGKIDPNNSDYYANIITSGMQKRDEKQLSLFTSASEKQLYVLKLIKSVQFSIDKLDTTNSSAPLTKKTLMLRMAYLKKMLESLKTSN